MGLFTKEKKDKKEPLDFSATVNTPVTEENKVVVQPQIQQKTELDEKLAKTLTFIYDSVTDNNVELDNFEWSLCINENRKLTVRIETL